MKTNATSWLQIRVKPADKAIIQSQATREKLKVSEFIKRLVLAYCKTKKD